MVEEERVIKNTYHIGSSTRACPKITGLFLTLTTAIGLPGNLASIASREDIFAVSTSLKLCTCCELGCFRVAGHGEDASSEESEDWDSEELHFEDFCVVSLIVFCFEIDVDVDI